MRNILSIISAMALLTACSGSDSKYDASGVFEVTEVMVSARVAGEIMELDLDEGTEVTAGKPVGYIDTVQLYLQRLSSWTISLLPSICWRSSWTHRLKH